MIAPRHPGYGAASGATDLRSVDDLAYLYLDLLDELKLDNVVLVGASFGGWIALEMCVRNRARLAKLVLVSSVGVKFSGREERDFADLFYMPDIEAFPMLFADWQRHAPSYAAMSAGQLQELARERHMLAHYGWRPYLHNPGLKRWLHRVDLPTLVLWGEADRFARPSYGQSLASALPAAELRSFEGRDIIPRSSSPKPSSAPSTPSCASEGHQSDESLAFQRARLLSRMGGTRRPAAQRRPEPAL